MAAMMIMRQGGPVLPPPPYREQSKTRKRFARGTPEAVKDSLRRRRNREAAQDLRDRKRRYELALQARVRELTADVDELTAEEVSGTTRFPSWPSTTIRPIHHAALNQQLIDPHPTSLPAFARTANTAR
mmetsp:Transcript_22536/g.58833  ORF Transcript_22536/g.58833 Transcript_22536/m.58833 type:complete len:129 (+) Transcript_22536:172-558(+)